MAIGHRYPDALAEEVRRALAKRHGVLPGQIALACGSSQILQMADTAFLEANRTVVAAEPTFEAVLGYADVLNARAIKVPEAQDFSSRSSEDGRRLRCDDRRRLRLQSEQPDRNSSSPATSLQRSSVSRNRRGQR